MLSIKRTRGTKGKLSQVGGALRAVGWIMLSYSVAFCDGTFFFETLP